MRGQDGVLPVLASLSAPVAVACVSPSSPAIFPLPSHSSTSSLLLEQNQTQLHLNKGHNRFLSFSPPPPNSVSPSNISVYVCGQSGHSAKARASGSWHTVAPTTLSILKSSILRASLFQCHLSKRSCRLQHTPHYCCIACKQQYQQNME